MNQDFKSIKEKSYYNSIIINLNFIFIFGIAIILVIFSNISLNNYFNTIINIKYIERIQLLCSCIGKTIILSLCSVYLWFLYQENSDNNQSLFKKCFSFYECNNNFNRILVPFDLIVLHYIVYDILFKKNNCLDFKNIINNYMFNDWLIISVFMLFFIMQIIYCVFKCLLDKIKNIAELKEKMDKKVFTFYLNQLLETLNKYKNLLNKNNKDSLKEDKNIHE